ncbi:hypothetical protein GH714_000875 [Hevea brasiliensis]|uniref:Uncharacterized protein n=1 Tax=Hevea brasiliensis TaxID=3981 RepID=A0A6A6M643_HEVBR|nr:hypothetical protein GH714_000875 [Hevea brasiliensis]
MVQLDQLVWVNSDAADFGSEVRESLVGGSSEGDIEYFHEHDVGIGGLRPSHPESDKKYIDRHNRDEKRISKQDSNTYVSGNDKVALSQVKDHRDGGFSFPPPLRDGDGQLGQAGSDDMLAAWRQKSSDSSTVKSSRDENNVNAVRSAASSPSTLSNYGYAEQEHAKKKRMKKLALQGKRIPGHYSRMKRQLLCKSN